MVCRFQVSTRPDTWYDEVEGLVPRAVLTFIKRYRLYSALRSGNLFWLNLLLPNPQHCPGPVAKVVSFLNRDSANVKRNPHPGLRQSWIAVPASVSQRWKQINKTYALPVRYEQGRTFLMYYDL